MKELKGCITAIITPFDKKLQIDYDGLEEIIEFQIKNGISGITPLGTTGESPTITDEERTRIIKTAIKKADGRVPVIPGTGSYSTEHTIKYTKEAEELGADAVLIVTPYYNKPSQEGIYRHFEAISKATDIPIIAYNIAGRTGVNIETTTLLRMSSLNNIIGVKEASGNISQISDVIDQLPKGFTVLSGDDNITLPLMALGGKGVISVVGNLLPGRLSEMVRSALAGNMKKATQIHYKLMPIFKGAFIDSNPIPIKTAMRLSGMPSGGFRLPLCNMTEQKEEKLRLILSKYNELKLNKN
jgi:4-hydroxy-tetrahydrodipicolinate synthase